MSKSLFKTVREMKPEDRKKLVRTLLMTVSLAVFVSGVGLTLYSCKSEVPSVEAYKAETDWAAVIAQGVWVKQTCRIAALDSVERIRFTLVDGNNWKVRLESSDARKDECPAVIDKESGSLSFDTGVFGLHFSEHEGYWLRLTSASGEVADFVFEN